MIFQGPSQSLTFCDSVILRYGTGCREQCTLNEISIFSPPQTSSPESYVPSSKKYFLSMENRPPAITGHLGTDEQGSTSVGHKIPILFTLLLHRNHHENVSY